MSSVSSAKLGHLLGTKPYCVLVGSGISAWLPTELPTGAEFTAAVAGALFENPLLPMLSAHDKLILDILRENVPFEMLLERCPDHTRIRTIISTLYATTKSNAVHEFLATLLISGHAVHLVTTNYDLGLDNALSKNGSNCRAIVTEADVTSNASSTQVYFKIHGCASQESSIICTLSSEPRLEHWKRKLLHNLIRDRNLLIIGYSGLDFDICPEIALGRPVQVLWNFRSRDSSDRSPGRAHLEASGIPVHTLEGDMFLLLERLGFPFPCLASSRGSIALSGTIEAAFSVNELLLWRVRLLNSMGFDRQARESLVHVSGRGYSETVERAQALFHHGAYRQASELFLKAAHLTPDTATKVNRQLDSADALRCYGSWYKAWKLVSYARRTLRQYGIRDSRLIARAVLKRTLILYDVARLLRGITPVVRVLCSADLRRAADLAVTSGDWMTFQQVGLLAERLGIDMSAVDQLRPFPSYQGYVHLGYWVGQILSVLDQPKGKSYLELRDAYRLAWRLGSEPHAWKLASTISRLYAAQPTFRQRKLVHLRRCEYSRILYYINLVRR